MTRLLRIYTQQVKVKVLAARLCLTLCDPVDCSPLGSSVHGNLQPRILEWAAMPSSGISNHLWCICKLQVSCQDWGAWSRVGGGWLGADYVLSWPPAPNPVPTAFVLLHTLHNEPWMQRERLGEGLVVLGTPVRTSWLVTFHVGFLQ